MSTHFPVRPGLMQHVAVNDGTYSSREKAEAKKVHILNLPAGGEGGGPVSTDDVTYENPDFPTATNATQAFEGAFGNIQVIGDLVEALTQRVSDLENEVAALKAE